MVAPGTAQAGGQVDHPPADGLLGRQAEQARRGRRPRCPAARRGMRSAMAVAARGGSRAPSTPRVRCAAGMRKPPSLPRDLLDQGDQPGPGAPGQPDPHAGAPSIAAAGLVDHPPGQHHLGAVGGAQVEQRAGGTPAPSRPGSPWPCHQGSAQAGVTAEQNSTQLSSSCGIAEHGPRLVGLEERTPVPPGRRRTRSRRAAPRTPAARRSGWASPASPARRCVASGRSPAACRTRQSTSRAGQTATGGYQSMRGPRPGTRVDGEADACQSRGLSSSCSRGSTARAPPPRPSGWSSTCARRGRQARATREPSTGPVGRLLREILLGGHAPRRASRSTARTMALLFAADRLRPPAAGDRAAAGGRPDVVSDRYLLSSLAYQAEEADRAWVAVAGPGRAPARPDLAAGRARWRWRPAGEPRPAARWSATTPIPSRPRGRQLPGAGPARHPNVQVLDGSGDLETRSPAGDRPGRRR